MNARTAGAIAFTALAALLCSVARAQSPISDNFTGTTTSNQWLFYNGACLTAGSTSVSGNEGQATTNGYTFPGCVSIQSSYYGEDLVGGVDGYLGSSSAPGSLTQGTPDPNGQGALRFTNGHPGGYAQNGAIVSASTFPTGEGIVVQFETLTYRGDSGGAGGDGADGMSFYLLDGCMPIEGGTIPSGCSANAAYGSNGTTSTTTFPGIGSWGGSLAYTCSNTNTPYDGLVGAYLGLGIDEYGNFLNGTTNTLGETGTSATGDNTASGGGYKPGRIGLRGAGSVAWQALNNAYGTDTGDPQHNNPYYPSSLSTSARQAAVQLTCENGTLYNYHTASSPKAVGATSLTNTVNTAGILDYTAIPGAYSVLSGVQIASEGSQTRTLCASTATSDASCVMPIVYNLKITQTGLLSLSYSVNGGATQQVIKNQDITTSNGPLPSSFRFGFAGSTGGDTNIHEILCFQAQPSNISESSAGVNQQPSSKIESGTGAYAYFTYYDPNNWTGRITANALETDSNGNLVVATTPTWDGSCVLTGGTCSSMGGADITVEAPSSRVVLSWNGTQGTAFQWSDLSSVEQAAMDSGDPSGETEPWYRVAYLRGDRTNEVNTSGTCTAASLSPAQSCLRARDDVLGDIVDSSPSWVGPPESPYTISWSDRLFPTATVPETATGAQTYAAFVTAEETRQNVVYVGANDGLLHGFRSGASNANGTFNTSAANDGYEVLAYMPGATISGAVLSAGTSCSTGGGYNSGTSVVDTIHGTNPASCNAVTTNIDYANPQYGHNFYVDATPGSGDLFYNGAWHTWLVGGLGAGGAVIYALDVTTPSNFSESDAANLVMGEWNPATISCANVTTTPGCGQSLGNTYGTPEIRRLHNGTWGVIFGNGFGSASGDAGIYILTISSSASPTSSVPTETLYYLSTGTSGTNNGIAYVTPVDLDGDYITDYVYAGDLNGNVWRFDLTSDNPANWGIKRCLDASCATSGTDYVTTPLFTTASGQPITTQLVVASGQTAAGAQTVIVAFGTGQKYPFTNTGATSFVTGTQAIYGVWDWAMANWNSKSTAQYAALTPANTGLSSSYTIVAPTVNTTTPSNYPLAAQTFTVNTTGCSSNPPSATCGDRDITENATVCWQGTSACSSGTNDQFGWYVYLPGGTSQLPEQIVFSPELIGGAFVVNSTVPPTSTLLSCTPSAQTGYTYALQVLSGGAFSNFFPLYNDYIAAGVATNATGTSFPLQTGNGQDWLVFQTYQSSASTGSSGSSSTTSQNTLNINVPSNTSGHRVTWTELR